MSSVMEMLGQALGGDAVGEMSRQLGADQVSTGKALSAALPLLLGALSRNASRGNGAEELLNAVSRDHDGSVLDNLGGFLKNAQSGPGDGILGHVLGSRRPVVEKGLSRASGLDAGSVGKMLTMLAPIVMGALGKAQRSSPMDPRALTGMLNRDTQEMERQEPKAGGILSSLLDTDGDGDVDMSDLAKHGFGLMGKMFRN
jgi:hypothetical protein